MDVRFKVAAVFLFSAVLAGCGSAGRQATTLSVVPPALATPAPSADAAVAYLQSSSATSSSGTIVAGTQQALIAVMSGATGSPSFAQDRLSVSAAGAVSSTARQTTASRAVPPPHVNPVEAFAADDTQLLQRVHALPHNDTAAPPRAAKSVLPSALNVGTTATLWVQKGSLGGSRVNVQVPATLEIQSAHGNIWVDDTLQLSQSDLRQIAADFENAYASDTAHFASPDYPSNAPAMQQKYNACSTGGTVQGSSTAYISEPADRRIDVMVVNSQNLGGLGGYFSAANLMPQSVLNCLNGSAATYESNEAPFIFVGWFADRGPAYDLQEDLVRSTAHELQHLINFVNHGILAPGAASASFNGNESSYINEGLSMLAQDLAVAQMYGSQGVRFDVDDALSRANVYLSAPENYSLSGFAGVDPVSWGGDGTAQYNCGGGCYGAAYLFQRYLRDRFGGDAYTHAIETSGLTGARNLQSVTGESASSLFGDFALAMAADSLHLTGTDPRFALGSLNLSGSYTDQFGAAMTLGGLFSEPLSGNSLTVTAPVGGFAFVELAAVPSGGATVSVSDDGAVPGFALEGGLARK